ncbi:LAME_0C04192g1_1 [Lachancea meyersii CBS 8951]|uniref:Nuclear fusion protein KAR5 n=1 Tax=Lachancea meyersii CBS 8951 TaxID=1266667 RepID=A0A1G4J0S4_9SACH|nr:LAME_0C04192g1_1 [Lachancea meyersii CBS 8951]
MLVSDPNWFYKRSSWVNLDQLHNNELVREVRMGTKLFVLLILTAVHGQQIQKLDFIDHLSRSLQEPEPSLTDLGHIIELNFPFSKSFCAGQALKEFLPVCLKSGIEMVDPKLKVQAAVKLSFCEFEESGLEARPLSCSDLSSEGIKKCVDELRSSPQWWTTYSGHYQRLPTLCYEQSFPYEKDQLLALFLNITRVYSSFSETVDAELTKNFANLERSTAKMMNSLQETFEDRLTDLDQLYADKMRSFTDVFDEVQKEAFTGFNDIVLAVRNDVLETDTDFWLEFKSLKQHLEEINLELNNRDFADQIRALKDECLQHAELASEHGLSHMQAMDKALEYISIKSSEKISDLNENIADSYVDVVTAFHDFRNLVQNSVIPVIQDEMHPHLDAFTQKLLTDLQVIDQMMEGKTEAWSDNLDSTFERVNDELNHTAATVQQLETDIKMASSELGSFISTLHLAHSIVLMTFNRVFRLASLIPIAARPLLVVPLLRLIPIIGSLTPRIETISTYLPSSLHGPLTIFSALVAGSLVGFYVIV